MIYSNFYKIWANNNIKPANYILLFGIIFCACFQVIWHFGFEWQGIVGAFLTYVLIVQTYIDLKYQIIPDEITWPMLWFGILVNVFGIFAGFKAAMFGAICGYFSLWLIYWAFYIVTKKEGLGYGDFKLLAMLGAWLGWQMLPLIILLSTVLGSIVGIGAIIFTNKKFYSRIPFGPFLASSGWVALMWGNAINTWYLNL